MSFVYDSPKRSIEKSSMRQQQQFSPHRNNEIHNSRLSVTFNPNQSIPPPQPSNHYHLMAPPNRVIISPQSRRSVSFDSKKSRNMPINNSPTNQSFFNLRSPPHRQDLHHHLRSPIRDPHPHSHLNRTSSHLNSLKNSGFNQPPRH